MVCYVICSITASGKRHRDCRKTLNMHFLIKKQKISEISCKTLFFPRNSSTWTNLEGFLLRVLIQGAKFYKTMFLSVFANFAAGLKFELLIWGKLGFKRNLRQWRKEREIETFCRTLQSQMIRQVPWNVMNNSLPFETIRRKPKNKNKKETC